MKPRILLTDGLDAPAEAALAAAADVVRVAARDEATLRAAVIDCDAIVAKTSTAITRAVLEAGRRLRVVGVAGVGLDRLDEAAASELGIRVIHTPAAASDAVAELAVALMLQLLRPIGLMAAQYRGGDFAAARREPHGVELRTLTVGILGMGRIGSRVGRICAAGIGARVIYADVRDVGPFEFAATRVELRELLRESDVLTLHVPLTSATRGMISGDALREMPPTSRLINTSRGAVVETAALVDALKSGRLAGAALDVTDPEPLPTGHPLLHMEQCIVTPHIAARTHGGFRRMNAVVDEVLAALGAGNGRRVTGNE